MTDVSVALLVFVLLFLLYTVNQKNWATFSFTVTLSSVGRF